MLQRITLAIVLAASLLCAGSQTAQAQTQKSYYHGYYFYYYYNGGYQPYALPTAYYYNYPSVIYVDTPPVWFTPPAPPVVININITAPATPAVVTPAAPVREWKTLYPIWAKSLLGKELNNEFWVGKDRYKLHEGDGTPTVPSGKMPTEIFVSTYSRDSMHFIEFHHLGGKTSLYKKVSK